MISQQLCLAEIRPYNLGIPPQNEHFARSCNVGHDLLVFVLVKAETMSGPSLITGTTFLLRENRDYSVSLC
jgi:hypothetical protein